MIKYNTIKIYNKAYEMLGISYQDWCNTVQGIYNTSINKIQLYPFKYTKHHMNDLLDENFFDKFIKNGLFFLDKDSRTIIKCYTLIKKDNTLRNATTISPLFYLIYNTYAKMISRKITLSRPSEVSVYYAGNLLQNEFFYKNQYELFYKEVTTDKDYYEYFIVHDLQNFFPSINIETLFTDIYKTNMYTPNEEIFWKGFVNYIGNNFFPTIDNCVASSYIATVIYLDSVDKKIYKYFEYLVKKEILKSFKIIRYVDDCYIFFNMCANRESNYSIDIFYHDVMNHLINIYFEKGLTINKSKSSYHKSKDINETVKSILRYSENNDNQEFNIIIKLIEENCIDLNIQFSQFLDKLISDSKNKMDLDIYNSIFNGFFKISALENYDSHEVFNFIIYRYKSIIKNNHTKILQILNKNNLIVKFDPTRWAYILYVSNKKNNNIEKKMIEHIEISNQENKPTKDIHNTTLLLHYLSQTHYKNQKLIAILEEDQKEYYDYINKYCTKDFIAQILSLVQYNKNKELYFLYHIINNKNKEQISKVIYVYTLSLYNKYKNNVLEYFSTYKSYFDGITSLFMMRKENLEKVKMWYYQKKDLKKVYLEENEESKVIQSQNNEKKNILQKACELRNTNPVAHITNNSISKKNVYYDSINDLEKLIQEKIDLLYNKKNIY